jgi:nucleoid DNA-binding protein
MNKSDLMRALFERQDLSLREAEVSVNTIFGAFCEALIRGEQIEIRRFRQLHRKELRILCG